MTNKLIDMQGLEGDYYKLVLCEGAKKLLLVFSSADAAKGKFTFFKSAIDLPAHKLYLNDKNYYQRGIAGLGETVDEVVQVILSWKQQLGVEEIYIFGSSMGSFGAMLYGAKLNAKVLCFGPRAILKYKGIKLIEHMPKNVKNNLFWRILKKIKLISRLPKSTNAVYKDLRPMLEKSQVPILVYAGEANQGDLITSILLNASCNATCIHLRGVGHKVPEFLHRKMKIGKVIAGFLADEPIVDLDESSDLYETIDEVKPLLRIEKAIKKGKLASAKQLLLEHIQKEPQSDLAHYKLGIVLSKLKDFKNAAAHQREAIKLCPHFANAHLQLGTCLNKLKKYEAALVYLQRAQELTVKISSAYYQAAISLENLQRFDECEIMLEKAVEQAPKKKKYQIKFVKISKKNAERKLNEADEKQLVSSM